MYYSSNEPYKRVDKKRTKAGVMVGAGMGAAMAGSVQYGSSRFAKDLPSGVSYSNSMGNVSISEDVLRNMDQQSREALAKQTLKGNPTRPNFSKKVNQRGYGSGWRKAATYGGAALAGGIIGGMMSSD